MRVVQLRRVLAVIALGLIGTACTSGGLATRRPTTSDSRPRPTATTTTLPKALTSATPTGWVPVDYGDAQVSVPANWEIGYDMSCPMAAAPGTIFVGISGNATCYSGAATGVPYVIVSHLVSPSSSLTHAPLERTINGIKAWGRVGSNGSGYYEAPELGVRITLRGNQSLAVLATLTRSPATVAVATGPAPAVPKSWKWVTGGSVSFAVPANWPTATSNVEGPGCGRPIVVAPKDTVVLDSDVYSGATMRCPPPPIRRPVPVTPTNGIVVNLRPQARFWPPSDILSRCLHRRGVTACLYDRTPTATNDQMAELDLLLVQVTVQGHPGHELLEIGLAGNGMVARTILYSLTGDEA